MHIVSRINTNLSDMQRYHSLVFKDNKKASMTIFCVCLLRIKETWTGKSKNSFDLHIDYILDMYFFNLFSCSVF